MLTIETLEKIKNGSKVTFINGIYTVLLGFFYIIFIKFLSNMNFSIANSVWPVFAKYNPEISAIYLRLMILKGVFIIALGIAVIYLSMHILKKKDKKTWVYLFIIGLIFWPGLLTMEILDKNLYTIAASFIGWISFIIGMIIPLKYYMQKEYSEY